MTHDGARRQPATITVVQTLLVLSAVGSAVGLVVSVYLFGVVLDLVTRFQTAFSPFAGAGAASQPTPGFGSSPQLTVSAVLGVVEVVAVVAVSIWAFRAVGQARAVARVVLVVLAAAQVVLSVTSTLIAGAGVGLVVVAAVIGLLVFDAPVLILLFVPTESRQWFDGSAPSTSATHGPGPSAPPPPSWGPPTPSGPPRSAPFPAARPSGPFPQPPPQPPRHGSGPDAGGRHAAPRPPQH